MPGAADIPAVDLVGASMLALVEAIPEFEARTGRRATVIGGLAVLCRLGTVYRVTGDLDTLLTAGLSENRLSLMCCFSRTM
jgi:preprotein translocase subunit SecY